MDVEKDADKDRGSVEAATICEATSQARTAERTQGLKLYHKNPRQITDKQFKDLDGSLLRLGDLGGIVHDLNSDEIIGGNQRSRVFDINKCAVEIVQQFDAPDEQGTVALGFVVWKGKRYAYRQVRWDAKQCEEANIRANKAGGGWDFDTLANEFELDELLEWGFDKKELDIDLWAGDAPEDAGAQIERRRSCARSGA